jgi:hypothetical protein
LSGERGRVVSGWATSTVGCRQFGGVEHVLADKAFVATREGINVGTHTSGTMDNSKVVAQKFLRPTADNMNLSVIIEDFFHRRAITNPVEHSTPEVFLVLGDTPSTASSFADK